MKTKLIFQIKHNYAHECNKKLILVAHLNDMILIRNRKSWLSESDIVLKFSAVNTIVKANKLWIITYDYKINLSIYSEATPSR